jgi:hypothetical protein
MFEKTVKIICLCALVLAAALRIQGGPRILLQLAVCGGAIFVMIQAARSRRYLWMIAFGIVAIYFNPILPVALSRLAELPVVLVCIALFAGSLRYLQTAPRMSLATITDLPARGESL